MIPRYGYVSCNDDVVDDTQGEDDGLGFLNEENPSVIYDLVQWLDGEFAKAIEDEVPAIRSAQYIIEWLQTDGESLVPSNEPGVTQDLLVQCREALRISVEERKAHSEVLSLFGQTREATAEWLRQADL